ncbi:hypothetical protein GCM10009737_25890 [Nocardioides lentus]|uniref:Nitrite/Sulfite reductase ferredoxin-like domain-containing protein n=1 Tax=Nocardioides lentus TaxID=338077 RepID=A0ABN2PM63_9ACTN
MRSRADRCPGLARPWLADDGALVRLRLRGGLLPVPTLARLLDVAATHGDGAVHLTRRANVQLRALPHHDGAVLDEVADAVRATGLVPSASHELVRNYLLSPPAPDPAAAPAAAPAARADLRGLLDDLDTAVCASPVLAGLSARFLLVLDDGRGDVVARSGDLGLVALSPDEGQLRVGDSWAPVVRLADAVGALVALAEAFVVARGAGPEAPWHVVELPAAARADGGAPLDHPLAAPTPPDPRLPAPTAPPPYDARHVAVPAGRLTAATPLPVGDGDLVVTPWRSLVRLPAADPARPEGDPA